jgi:hypothetical protein
MRIIELRAICKIVWSCKRFRNERGKRHFIGTVLSVASK